MQCAKVIEVPQATWRCVEISPGIVCLLGHELTRGKTEHVINTNRCVIYLISKDRENSRSKGWLVAPIDILY